MKKYNVTGMSCAACSARVEKAVSALEGVESCSVSLLTNSMGVEGSASAEAVIAAVEAAGYGATSAEGVSAREDAAKRSPGDPTEAGRKEIKLLRNRLLYSLGFLLLLMYISMGHLMWGWPLPQALASNPMALGLCQLVLTAIVLVINQKFFISGFRGLLHRAPNMDTLVALGAGASFIYSTAVLFLMTAAEEHAAHYLHDLYFESAAMILTLITVGKLLEAVSKGRTTTALKGLLDLSPKTATLLREGAEVTVPVEQVKKGDLFVVRPGEQIPTDGMVLEGSSAVDQSAMTGESLPVDKVTGDSVSAGTLNQSGFLKCEATRVGEDTTLSQIIKIMGDAAATKAPIAKAADKVSGIFVPAVLLIAALTAVVWMLIGQDAGFVMARAVSVLVISCPCALGLATPVAIMVGSGLGAKKGILYKTAESLELCGRAEILVLDKTGTVTKGEMSVTDLLPAEGTDETMLLTLALSLEKQSEHPLSRAIVTYAEAQGHTSLPISDFETIPGKGVCCLLNGQALTGGNLAYIKSLCKIPQAFEEKAKALAAQGKTPMFFAKDNEFLGILAVSDVIKEDSPEAIRELQSMGLEVVLLTGDNRQTAEAIGALAGVDHVIADVLPDGKAAVIERLKQYGRVMMVGDGINDAPALSLADIGVAIGNGTDIAIDAADIVLMKSSLKGLPRAVKLGRKTLRNIHENLFWAFFYNCIGIPLAAGVWIPLWGWQLNPMFGAAAMSLSSFCVVTNALRLNFVKLDKSAHSKKHENKIPADFFALSEEKGEKDMKKTMKITGMMCPHCSGRVKKVLEALPQVESAEVSHETGTAVVTLTADIANDTLKATVEEQGYDVTDIA